MEFVGTFWALVPAIVAIVLALITKEVYSSLFFGVLVGALLLASFQPVTAFDILVNQAMIPAVADTAGIFIFLVVLGALVALISKTGASVAFGRWAATHVHGRKSSLIATWFLGLLIFVDDYFNCLTVGLAMTPITDAKRVSRAKMAFIIDATAAPVCAIVPMSSLAAAAAANASDLGVNGTALYIESIPYSFYTLMMLVFIVTMTLMAFDYGPMAKAEMDAIRNGELGILGKAKKTDTTANGRVFDMLIPIILLIVVGMIGMLYVGGFFDASSDYAGDLVGAFGNTDATIALAWSSIIVFIITVIYLMCRKLVKFKPAMESLVEGLEAMGPAIIILSLACSLKNMTVALGAATVVAGWMAGAAEGLYMMLPAIIFLVAVGLSFATGTSWGTFGVLIPIVIPVLAAEPTLQVIGLGACVAGAVCGDHCSPISDTTIMASAGADVDLMKHVNTQLPYSLTVAAMAFVMYIVAGFIQNWIIMIPIWIGTVVLVCFILKKTVGKGHTWADMEAAPATASRAE